MICGDAYGLPHWPDATYTLAILLGIPDELAKDGCWRKRYRASARPLPRVRGDGSEEGDGIIVLSGGTGSMESLLMSVHSVRKHWSGSIQVWHQGPEDESLRLVCTRLGIEFFPICAKIRATEEFTNEACHGTRFRRTLILKPGQVLIGSPQFENGSDPVVRDRTGPMLVSRTDQIFTLRSGACIAGAEFDETREETILLGDGKSDHWSEAAWEKWCQIETEATEFNVTEIRVAPNSTVVTVVTPEEAGDFQRNWLTWRFRGASALVVLVDIAPEEFWLPGSESARILPVSGKDAADLVSLLGMISETCDTERVLLLPPLAAALPGAELWADLPDGWSAVHYPEFTRREVDITGNRFTPRNCFVLAPKNELKAIATRQPDGRLLNLSRIVIEWAGEREAQGGQVMFSNMAEFGWRFPAVCFLGNEPHRKWQPNDAIIRQHGDGRLQLADDVVVISLPERADRRKRMSEALDSWRVKFRFVDGVRLTDEEVDPNEVADVELDEWKRYVSEQKFLRGTAGCRRAHLRCFEEAYRSGVNSLLLIEDDMQFVDGWLDRYIAALAELPEGWLQLYLSGSDFLPSVPVSTNLHRLAGAYQTTAILYSEAGIEAALNALRVSRCEIDVWMARHLHPFGNSYAIRPDITYQDGGVSDILSFDRGVTP